MRDPGGAASTRTTMRRQPSRPAAGCTITPTGATTGLSSWQPVSSVRTTPIWRRQLTGISTRTIVVVTADHGDMLGERGLWLKMNFFEWSVRVPLIVHAPKFYRARRVTENVSLIDLFPTFLEWAGDGELPELFAPIDGASIAGLATGHSDGWPDIVDSEYCGEGASSPVLMIRPCSSTWRRIPTNSSISPGHRRSAVSRPILPARSVAGGIPQPEGSRDRESEAQKVPARRPVGWPSHILGLAAGARYLA